MPFSADRVGDLKTWQIKTGNYSADVTSIQGHENTLQSEVIVKYAECLRNWGNFSSNYNRQIRGNVHRETNQNTQSRVRYRQ